MRKGATKSNMERTSGKRNEKDRFAGRRCTESRKVEKECKDDWLFAMWGESGHLWTRGLNRILKIIGQIYLLLNNFLLFTIKFMYFLDKKTIIISLLLFY